MQPVNCSHVTGGESRYARPRSRRLSAFEFSGLPNGADFPIGAEIACPSASEEAAEAEFLRFRFCSRCNLTAEGAIPYKSRRLDVLARLGPYGEKAMRLPAVSGSLLSSYPRVSPALPGRRHMTRRLKSAAKGCTNRRNRGFVMRVTFGSWAMCQS